MWKRVRVIISMCVACSWCAVHYMIASSGPHSPDTGKQLRKQIGQYMILTFSSSRYLSAVVWWKGRGGTSDSSCSTRQLEPCIKGSVVIISIPDDIAHLQSPCSFPACAVCTFWQNKKDQQDIIQRRNILAHACWQISVVFVLHQSTTITKLWHSGFLKIC